MKHYLLAGLLFTAVPAFAQQTYKGPEVQSPIARSGVIILHSTDSAKVAYSKAVQAVLAAGYGIDKSDRATFFLSTTPKPLDSSVTLVLQLVATPTATGSDVTMRGLYTWLSAVTLMAHVEGRQMPVLYAGKGSSATQRAWLAMQQVALTALPGAQIGYK